MSILRGFVYSTDCNYERLFSTNWKYPAPLLVNRNTPKQDIKIEINDKKIALNIVENKSKEKLTYPLERHKKFENLTTSTLSIISEVDEDNEVDDAVEINVITNNLYSKYAIMNNIVINKSDKGASGYQYLHQGDSYNHYKSLKNIQRKEFYIYVKQILKDKAISTQDQKQTTLTAKQERSFYTLEKIEKAVISEMFNMYDNMTPIKEKNLKACLSKFRTIF